MTAACVCGQRDAEREPDATDRVIVPTAADCPVHGSSAARTIEPATQEEIDLFCEETGRVRPDPSDERAVCSFASWFARWRHERRNGAGSW